MAVAKAVEPIKIITMSGTFQASSLRNLASQWQQFGSIVGDNSLQLWQTRRVAEMSLSHDWQVLRAV